MLRQIPFPAASNTTVSPASITITSKVLHTHISKYIHSTLIEKEFTLHWFKAGTATYVEERKTQEKSTLCQSELSVTKTLLCFWSQLWAEQSVVFMCRPQEHIRQSHKNINTKPDFMVIALE